MTYHQNNYLTQKVRDNARALERDIRNIVNDNGVDLVEVCAPPGSNLGSAVQRAGGSAVQLGLHSGHDLSTNTGFRRAVEELRALRPANVVFAPPCTARSRIQNLNKRTPEQFERWKKKCRKNDKITKGCCILAHLCMRSGAKIYFEQPVGCGTWQLECLDRLRTQLYESRIDGCAYGLRHPQNGMLMRKPWRIVTNDPDFDAVLGKTCQNRTGRNHRHEHANVEGAATEMSAAYPPRMCAVWARHMLHVPGVSQGLDGGAQEPNTAQAVYAFSHRYSRKQPRRVEDDPDADENDQRNAKAARDTNEGTRK